MRPVERQFEFTVSAAREEVFALLSDARNLNLVTPEWFAFEILSERPGEMYAGALIEYRLKYRLLKMRWPVKTTAALPMVSLSLP